MESALSRFSRKCGADAATKALIKAELKKLKTNSELGYPVPFTESLFHQLPVGDYRIHYQIFPDQIIVLYMGKLGVC